MSAIGDFTALVWWLMLLASTGIILHDIAEASSSSKSLARPTLTPRPRIISSEDESITIARRIRRGLDRPSNFALLQRDIAQSIWQLAAAIHGQVGGTARKPDREMIERYIGDRDVSRYVEDNLTGQPHGAARITRGEMLEEFRKTVIVLERAESVLK